MRPPEFWNHRHGRDAAPMMRALLSPISWIYGWAAARRILAPNMVGPAVKDLLSDPDKLAEQKRLAYEFALSRDAVLDYVWDSLGPILPPTGRRA